MSVLHLPPCPPTLRSIQHYLKAAAEHEARDPVVTYWCRLYSMQSALKKDKKSDEAKSLLMALMEWLEKQKKLLSDNEAITNEVAAEAHIENYALRLFTWADTQDREGVFNKNVVKAFYTSALLFDVLTTFGEQTEEIAKNCKYAKWKASYIHNCLKNGEVPEPGPMGWSAENADEDNENFNVSGPSGFSQSIGFNIPPESNAGGMSSDKYDFPSEPEPPAYTSEPANPTLPSVSSSKFTPYSPEENNPQASNSSNHSITSAAGSNMKLNHAQMSKAQKYCKFAGSALNYDDVPEAINYLQKALYLLQTGQDS